MIQQTEVTLIAVGAIQMGQRRRPPTPEEIDRMAASIGSQGLLAPIGVRIDHAVPTVVFGATRLSAAQKLGWLEIPAVIFEGTDEEFQSAEIIENLERRHLNKTERDKLARELVELRTKEIDANDQPQELAVTATTNSSAEPKAHPKTRTPGARRGRPVTAAGRAKKEAAATLGVSDRTVRRATSNRPKKQGASRKDPANRDKVRLARCDEFPSLIIAISELFLACDRDDREMIRKENQPYLNGWFGADGKLIVPKSPQASVPEGGEQAPSSVPASC